MTDTEAKTAAPMTTNDLFDVLAENIQRLRDGEASPAVSNAIVNSASTMLRIWKLQMEYAKQTNSTPEIPMLTTGSNGTRKDNN